MRPILTDRVVWFVGLSVTVVSQPAKRLNSKQIGIPFGIWARLAQGTMYMGGPDRPMGRGNFEGEVEAHCKV